MKERLEPCSREGVCGRATACEMSATEPSVSPDPVDLARQAASERGEPVLARQVIPCTLADPWRNLPHVSPDERWFAWAADAMVVLARGSLAHLGASSKDGWLRFLQSVRRHLLTPADHLPVAVGGCSFNRYSGRNEWQGWPAYELVVPQTLWVSTPHGSWRIEHSWVTPAAPTAAPATSPSTPRATATGVAAPSWTDLESETVWRGQINAALQAIADGAFSKVVPARRQRARACGRRVDLSASLQAFRERCPQHVCFGVNRPGAGAFLGATPETLVRVEAQQVWADALAGTITAEQGGASALEASDKDLREHRWVADNIDAVLRPRCAWLERSGPMARPYRSLYHLRTDFHGALRDADELLALVTELHPTPAVGGWPKGPALQFLQENEPFDRGWFAAPVGWVAPDGSGHFAVALRSALARDQQAYAYAGAGVVAGSEPAAEWAETAAKLATARECLRWRPDA